MTDMKGIESYLESLCEEIGNVSTDPLDYEYMSKDEYKKKDLQIKALNLKLHAIETSCIFGMTNTMLRS